MKIYEFSHVKKWFLAHISLLKCICILSVNISSYMIYAYMCSTYDLCMQGTSQLLCATQ